LFLLGNNTGADACSYSPASTKGWISTVGAIVLVQIDALAYIFQKLVGPMC
jgi:hypothetical protein